MSQLNPNTDNYNNTMHVQQFTLSVCGSKHKYIGFQFASQYYHLAKYTHIMPNITVLMLQLLLHIQEVLGSILSQHTNYLDWCVSWFMSVSSDECRGILKYTTTTFLYILNHLQMILPAETIKLMQLGKLC